MVGLARPEHGAWELRLIRGIREVLGLEAQRAPARIGAARLPAEAAVQKIAGVELEARLVVSTSSPRPLLGSVTRAARRSLPASPRTTKLWS